MTSTNPPTTTTTTTTTSPPPPQTQPDHPDLTTAYSNFKHYAATTMLLASPLLIAIPPRKLDLYTFSLVGAFVASANQLNKERTGGKGLIAQFGYKSPFAGGGGFVSSSDDMERREGGRRLLEESPQEDEVQRQKIVVARDWKEQRLKEEQEKLDGGEGYGDIIVDQIWDVWNQKGKNKSGVKGTVEED